MSTSFAARAVLRNSARTTPTAATFRSRQSLRPALPRQHAQAQARRGFADTTAKAQEAASNHTPAIVGGLVGGTFVFLAGYSYYHFSGAKTFVNTLHRVSSTFNSATKSVQQSAPEPNEALKWLKESALSYAAFIPGAKHYVSKAFDDLETVHQKHAGEVDETYNDLKAISKKGSVSLDTAGEAMSVLGNAMDKIMALAGDAAEDLLDNHPEIKKQLGGSVDQLKAMGEDLGPEAKKQLDDTWKQVRDLASKGLGVSTIPQIKQLIDDKVKELKQFGSKAWDKGMEQAKPYLDKTPQVKELLEKNKDALLQGDLGTLVQRLKDAASSGDSAPLEQFVRESVDKAKSKASGGGGGTGGLEKYLALIPGGSDVAGKLQKLADIGSKHGKEAEALLSETVKEIESVLAKKMDKAEALKDKAKEDASK